MKELVTEVAQQPEVLAKFARASLPRAPDGSVFVGAGDSYAAALLGHYASKGRCRALDPYVLWTHPEAARGAEVFFISASGRTSSNMKALSKVRRIARQTTTLTAAEGSPLADGTDEVVKLPMAYVARRPGLLSFTLSALAVMRMVGVRGSCDFHRVFEYARRDGGTLSIARGTTYFLGNSLAHAAALYASAKVYEFLGTRAHADLLEEFAHAELFSLGPPDHVNSFAAFDPWMAAARLSSTLSGEGYSATTIPDRGRSELERFFHCVFVVQLASLGEAEKSGLKQPAFLGRTGRLRVSDMMIY